MSGEIDADVADAYRDTRRTIEKATNRELDQLELHTDARQWAVIAIIRSHDHPDYGEVTRRDESRGVLEFRLRLNHGDFLKGDRIQRAVAVIETLRRSTILMGDLGVSEADRRALSGVLDGLLGRLPQDC
jgi:hypothetical protein